MASPIPGDMNLEDDQQSIDLYSPISPALDDGDASKSTVKYEADDKIDDNTDDKESREDVKKEEDDKMPEDEPSKKKKPRPVGRPSQFTVVEKSQLYTTMVLNKAAKEGCFSSFNLKIAREVKELKAGMKLEALDRNNPCNYCIATVINVSGHRVLIRYDGFGKDDSHDFWCDFQADELFPIGFCASNNYPLQPPTGIKSSLEEWKTFLTKTLTGALAAPVELFREPMHRKPRRVHSFQVGMTVECVHPKMPSIVCIGVISKSLGPYYYLITTDACDEVPSVSFCCHNDSPLVFPIGWCKTHNVPLTLSTTAKAKGLTVDQYAKLCSSKAAPPTALYKLSRMCPFRIGQKVEAVDMEHPSIIRIATVHNLLGRVVEMMFDGLTRFQFTDLECQSLYPIGWCAETGHPLHTPHGIMSIKSAFSLPSRNVRSPPRPGRPANRSKYPIQKKAPIQEQMTKNEALNGSFPMPSFRSVVDRDRSRTLESKVYFNKTCHFGDMLDPIKVMEASRCTMPSKPAVVLRRTLERLLCVSKSPDKLAQVIQEGLDVKIIVRGKVVRKNLSQYDNRPCAVQFLKLLCQRLGCCEYFLSYDVQYVNECPLQCKVNMAAMSQLNSPSVAHCTKIQMKTTNAQFPTAPAAVASTQHSFPMVMAQEQTLLANQMALPSSQRPILPSNLQPSFTVARGHPSSFPFPVSSNTTSYMSQLVDTTTSSTLPSNAQPTPSLSRLLIDSSGTKLVANIIRSSIQNGKLGSPTTLKTPPVMNQGESVSAMTAARVSSSGDNGLKTLLIVHTTGNTMSTLPTVSVVSSNGHLSLGTATSTGDTTRHVQGTLLLNDSSSAVTGSLHPASPTQANSTDTTPLSVPSTLIIPKNSLIQMGDGTNMSAGKLLLQPIHFPARCGTSSLTIPIQESQTTIVRPSIAVTTCMSTLGAVTNSVMTQIGTRPSIPYFQGEPIPTIKFNARNHTLPAGKFSVISTQHSQTRRAVAVVPPANGVVRSPVQGVIGLRSPHPMAPGVVGPVIRGPAILSSTAGPIGLISPTNLQNQTQSQIPGIQRTLGFVASTSAGTGYVISKQVTSTAAPTDTMISPCNVLLRSPPSYDSLNTSRDMFITKKEHENPGTKSEDISSSNNSVSVAYVSLQSNSKDKIMYVPLRPGTGLNQQLLLYHPNSSNQISEGTLPQTYYGGKIIPTSAMTSFRIQGAVVNGNQLSSVSSSATNGFTDQRSRPTLILPRRANDDESPIRNGIDGDRLNQDPRKRRQYTRKKGFPNEMGFNSYDDSHNDGDYKCQPQKGLKRKYANDDGSPLRIEPADRRVRHGAFLTDPLSNVQLPNNPEEWTPDDVAKFIEATDCPVHAGEFLSQEIDGKALLLLTREALMDFAGLKLGPALKVCSYIAQLKTRIKQTSIAD